MATGRVDVLIRSTSAAARPQPSTVAVAVSIPAPSLKAGATATPAVVSRSVSIPSPTITSTSTSSFGVNHVVGAAANYSNHPTIILSPRNSRRLDINKFDDELGNTIGETGHVIAGPHFYSGSSWPTTFDLSGAAGADDDGYAYAWLNVKSSSWADVKNGAYDAHCTTFVNSVPAGVKLIFTLDHEPENDGTQPSSDGGTYEDANGPIWSQAQARIAGIVATLNRSNVYYAVVHQAITFPDSGQLGDLGDNNRDPENWNPWRYMSAAAKARTILAPDGYTKVRTTVGTATTGTTSSSIRITDTEFTSQSTVNRFATDRKVLLFNADGTLREDKVFTITGITSGTGVQNIAVTPSFTGTPPNGTFIRLFEAIQERFDNIWSYVNDASWGVDHIGVSEHTINNDVFVEDAATAAIWREDIRPYMRDLRDGTRFPDKHFAYWLLFCRSDTAGASGNNGWIDLPGELDEAGRMTWEMNTGEVT